MEEFINYKRDKAYWFGIYLELAAVICEFPALSAKNSNFQDNLAELDGFPIDLERDAHDTHDTKQKRI